ncbi:MAG: DUF6362 family protein [Aestuariivirga sp.]|uniref:DUF6362 family protein n=1 Tax=Aestuariivirga sp. TaxID=2650926 RepID=UPI0038D23B67
MSRRFSGPLSPNEIEDRFEEAARTLRRLPGIGVRGHASAWPPIVRAAADAYGWEAATAPRLSPSPQAISQMEETFTWLSWLREPDDARIVWLRAEGVRWKPICWRIGLSRASAWRRWAAALITIANRHNAGLIRPMLPQPGKKATPALRRKPPHKTAKHGNIVPQTA